ncbi:MAG: hypothetical protein AB7U38_09505 [Hyphomicrobiales bacterium]
MFERFRNGRTFEIAVAVALTAIAIVLVLTRFGGGTESGRGEQPVASITAQPMADKGQ